MSQFIRKIITRTQYIQYIYQPEIIVSVFTAGSNYQFVRLSQGICLETIRGILNEALIENALINMGNSSILALGNHPVGSGWKINDILLHNECLTTSGNDSPNRRHIVSPRNGKLVEGVKQIAVVTTDGSIGEILSTSLFAADSEQRKALLAEFSSVLSQFFLIGC